MYNWTKLHAYKIFWGIITIATSPSRSPSVCVFLSKIHTFCFCVRRHSSSMQVKTQSILFYYFYFVWFDVIEKCTWIFFFVDKRHLSFFIYMSQLLQNVVVVFVSDFKLLIRRTSAHSSNTTSSFFCVLFESSIPFSIEKGDLIPFICDFFFLFACLLFYNTKKLLFVRIRKEDSCLFSLIIIWFYLFIYNWRENGKSHVSRIIWIECVKELRDWGMVIREWLFW